MSENVTLEITEKHVTFNPVVQVKTIAPNNNVQKVVKPQPIRRPVVRSRFGLQFVR